MTDFEYLNQVHAEIRRWCSAEPDNAHLRHLERQTWDRVRAAQRREGLPLVLRFDAPGYVEFGVKGHERIVRNPGLGGLDDAWRVFLVGVQAVDALHACDLVGTVGRPGNALRNRLAKAAEWLDREGCPELARCLRAPVLSVTDAGQINYNPAAHPEIDLGLLR